MLEALAPFAIQFLDLALLAVAAVAVGLIDRYLGVKVARETVHSALKTGVTAVIDVMGSDSEILDAAIDYAEKEGAPKSVKKLGATRDAMRRIAKAKLVEARATAAHHARRSWETYH